MNQDCTLCATSIARKLRASFDSARPMDISNTIMPQVA